MTEADAYILGVDPGTTTGLAVARFDRGRDGEPWAIWSGQLDWGEACERVSWWLERLYERAAREECKVSAVCEAFVINANTARRGQQGCEDALGMVGVARYLCGLSAVEFAPQQAASAAKAMVDDDTLKNLNLYSPALVHANDAYRHTILLAVKRRWMNPAWLAVGSRR